MHGNEDLLCGGIGFSIRIGIGVGIGIGFDIDSDPYSEAGPGDWQRCFFFSMQMKTIIKQLGTGKPVIAASILLAVMSCIAAASLCAANAESNVSIQGRIIIEPARPTVLETGEKRIPLRSDNESIAKTLQDKRLSGREMKLVGNGLPDGAFEVHDFFIIRQGASYRLIYFCDICNITTFSPGDCLCCQLPTVPIEVPPTDRRVYHEEVRSRPRD